MLTLDEVLYSFQSDAFGELLSMLTYLSTLWIKQMDLCILSSEQASSSNILHQVLDLFSTAISRPEAKDHMLLVDPRFDIAWGLLAYSLARKKWLLKLTHR